MSKIGDRRGIKLKRAVLRVGDGRGFVVSSRNSIGGHERIVITAAHCLPSFPPCAPAADLEAYTYRDLLGPLNASIAVLQPVLLDCLPAWLARLNVKIGSGGG